MNFNPHWNLKDKHAFLGASKYSWLNYDAEKLRETYASAQARYRGTRLHALASELIQLGIPLEDNGKTLNSFVNDAIGFRMKSEQILYYSDNCFGTADAIGFREKESKLRIHDLKTGTTPASMKQLYIYASLFFLEYVIDPHQIDTELRIYQFDDINICKPPVTELLNIMQKIRSFDIIINEMRQEGDSVWI